MVKYKMELLNRCDAVSAESESLRVEFSNLQAKMGVSVVTHKVLSR